MLLKVTVLTQIYFIGKISAFIVPLIFQRQPATIT